MKKGSGQNMDRPSAAAESHGNIDIKIRLATDEDVNNCLRLIVDNQI
jgi:head-tail adaptor